LWGSGITFAGFVLGYIPPLKDFVVEYIDLILLFAVATAVVPTAYHYVRGVYRARKARAAGVPPLTDEEILLPEGVLEHEPWDDDQPR